MLLPDHRAVFAFRRSLPDAELLVVANLSGDAHEISIDDAPAEAGLAVPWRHADVVITNQLGDDGRAVGAEWLEPPRLVLRPWEAFALRRSLAAQTDSPHRAGS